MTQQPQKRGAKTPPDSGFALIVVIWLAGLLGLFVLSFSQSARVHVGTAANVRDREAAKSLASAGVELAAMELLKTSRQENGPPRLYDGTARYCRLPDGSRLKLSITDTAGRVDLNIASDETLQSLFRGIGLAPIDARKLAAAVVDYRDADDLTRPDGAEAAEYRSAGLQVSPRNGPFRSIDELGLVLGSPPGLLETLRPYVTLRSGQRGIDPRVAAPELVALLRRGYEEKASEADLGSGFDSRQFSAGGQILPASLSAATARQAYVVRSTVARTNGATFVREAVLSLARPLPAPRPTQDDAQSARVRPVARRPGGPRPLEIAIWDWRTGVARDGEEIPDSLEPC